MYGRGKGRGRGAPIYGGYAVYQQQYQPAPAAVVPAPARYLYNGKSYGSYEEVMAAVRGGGGGTPAGGAGLGAQLEDKEALKQKVHELFRQYAGVDGHLSPLEMKQLALSLGAQLGVDGRDAFGDIEMTFWRFDFSGDGRLDEEEGMRLLKFLLRKYRDSQALPSEGGGKLIGGPLQRKLLEQDYEVGKKIGQGGQGAIYLATDRRNGQEKVVKFYEKGDANVPFDGITEEFELLSKLDHPRIARTYEIFEDSQRIYAVNEPYYGGDFTTAMERAQAAGVTITHGWLAGILKQAVQGMEYLHRKGTMHCDLKEQNVMVVDKDHWANPTVVVIDFGMAQNFSTGALGAGGTPPYMPPEVWQLGLWTPKGDVFSFGVMFYRMFTMEQKWPWAMGSMEQIQASIIACQPDMSPLASAPSYQALVTKMLSRNFHERPTMSQVLEAPWFEEALADSKGFSAEALDALARGTKKHDLQLALMADLADQENLSQLREIGRLFAELDEDNNGKVSADEARAGLQGHLPAERIEQLVEALEDFGGKITYTQFMGAMIATRESDDRMLLRKLFAQVDLDDSGTLTYDELEAMLAKAQIKEMLGDDRDAASLMRELDQDGSGQVSYQEFQRAMMGEPKGARATFAQGDAVEYYSSTHDQWLPCEISAVHPPSGSVQISVKPGYWLRPEEQRARLRPKA